MKPHGDVINLPYDHSRFMQNWWRAKECRGCKFLHIGESVNHNHCDNPQKGREEEKRVNGHNNSSDCTQTELKDRLSWGDNREKRRGNRGSFYLGQS